MKPEQYLINEFIELGYLKSEEQFYEAMAQKDTEGQVIRAMVKAITKAHNDAIEDAANSAEVSIEYINEQGLPCELTERVADKVYSVNKESILKLRR